MDCIGSIDVVMDARASNTYFHPTQTSEDSGIVQSETSMTASKGLIREKYATHAARNAVARIHFSERTTHFSKFSYNI